MKKVIKDEQGRRIHPYVPELKEQLRTGAIDRREFLRTATLLGVAAPAAYAMAGTILGEEQVVKSAAAQTPKAGGSLKFAMEVQEMTDPAVFDWTQKSNVSRHITEYLTITGPDNITRPYLAEGWEASDDLKTWTLRLRQGVKWNNGDNFGADDVVHNFKRWTDPATGSSNIGLFASMTEDVDTGKKDDKGNPVMSKRMTEGAVEKVDDHTVRLHLNSPVLSIPENLYNYPTAIVHRTFDETGRDLSKNPIGTGAYELAEFRIGEVAVLRKRSTPYWGGDVYLDEIRYVDTGGDPSAAIGALASKQVDGVYSLDISTIDTVEKLPGIVLHEAITAQTGCTRMKVTQKPFDDPRVRKAITLCCDNQRLLELAHRARGQAAENHHVGPIHPEYAELPPLKTDVELAKKLLAEAGYGDGLNLEGISGDAEGPWETAQMQAIKEMLAPAGINMALKVMPTAQYWEIWDKAHFSLTSWTHRPLGVMVLNLAYRSGVPWNETEYNNPEFDKSLNEASSILDVNERRKVMAKTQKILQDDSVMVQPFWRAIFTATTENVKGYQGHPTRYHQFNKVWLA